MPITNKLIYKENYGPPYNKTPFIMALIDRNGTLQGMTYPPIDRSMESWAPLTSLPPSPTILGIELMVNPASMSTNMAKIVNRTQSMVSFVEDHWGEELDTLTFQGKTASFVVGGNDLYSIRMNDSETSPTKRYSRNAVTNEAIRSDLYTGVGLGSSSLSATDGVKDYEIGLTTSRRRWSVSYKLFKRFIDLIRYNGCFFDNQGFVSKRYYIMLSYGNSAYRGLFESIDLTEDASSPFNFTYTITFKSEETIYSYVNYGSSATATPTK
jgi:hypothetical protein